MCFVIAGVQPRTRTIDQTPRRCPRCGSHQAVTQQVDHYFSLFFIPLLRIKQGDPFLYCQHCQLQVDSMGVETGPPPTDGPQKPLCRQCGRTLVSDFRYCPYCGRRQ